MLSEAGLARREAGVASLREVVRGRGRRRVVVRAGGGLVGALAVVVAVMVARSGAGGRSRVAESAPKAPTVVAPELASKPESAPEALQIAGVGLIRTDPGVLSATVTTDRRVVAELAPAVRASVDRIDDDALQRALRAAGERAGIVRIGRRVMTEAELAELGQAGM